MPLDRLTFALEAAQVGLWDWDIQSGELWWSENLIAIHGQSPDAFDGTFERFTSFIHADDRQRFLEAVDLAVKHEDNFVVEFRVIGEDDAPRWIRGQGRIFRDKAGEAVRVIGI